MLEIVFTEHISNGLLYPSWPVKKLFYLMDINHYGPYKEHKLHPIIFMDSKLAEPLQQWGNLQIDFRFFLHDLK